MKKVYSLLFGTVALLSVSSGQQLFDPQMVSVEGDLGDVVMRQSWKETEPGVYELKIKLTSSRPLVMPPVKVKWIIPSIDIYSIWNNKFDIGRSNYNLTMHSRIGGHLALLSYISKSDRNRLTFGISDNVNNIEISNKLSEEDASFYVSVDFFTDKPAQVLLEEYEVTIRFDTRDIRYEQALAGMHNWWQDFYPSARVPDAAMVPYYSTWYNFHHSLTEEEILKECRLAKTMGMEGIIIDAGWMTLDDEVTFDNVGDYEPLRLKKMGALVDSLHAIDMKVMLWYTLSMIGEKSKIAEVFQGKYIRKEGPRYIVDPRFPEVREHLIGILEKAAQKWGLDGFKLDFMSKMYPDPDTPNDLADGRDFASIDEATQQWIKDIYERLSVINPDLLIEFRQPHLNPATQQYGNMFRAIDNFNMEIANRIYIAKIKLAAPGLAVHSDMLKWHYDDPVDEAALQVLNGIFAVPQISVKLDSISKDHIAMVDFWMKYWTEHKDLMMKGHFQADDPGENYPAMHAFDDDRQISGLYATNLVKIKKSGIREIDIINATADETIYLDPGKEFGSKIQITTWNSQGQQVSKSHLKNRGDVIRIQAPKVGLVRIVGL